MNGLQLLVPGTPALISVLRTLASVKQGLSRSLAKLYPKHLLALP